MGLCGTARKMRSLRLSVRTPGFQPGKRGSIPLGTATFTFPPISFTSENSLRTLILLDQTARTLLLALYVILFSFVRAVVKNVVKTFGRFNRQIEKVRYSITTSGSAQ